MQALLAEQGERAFRAFVRRSDDRRLERTAGSGTRAEGALRRDGAGLRARQGGAASAGDLQYDLRRSNGERRQLDGRRSGPSARASGPGTASAPALTLKLGVVDFVRMAGGDLDPGKALLTGRMDMEGDLAVAARLGEMFGQPAAI